MAEEELTDVVLCYKAMGIALDATPAQIESRYNYLVAEYKKQLAGAEKSAVEEAKANLELVGEMYRKICGSITYHAMLVQEEKRSAQLQEARTAARKAAESAVTVTCPRCNGFVPKGLKSCPICKSPILSDLELRVQALLSPKWLLIIGAILAVIAFGVIELRSNDTASDLNLELEKK